jgi:hypothetical protein
MKTHRKIVTALGLAFAAVSSHASAISNLDFTDLHEHTEDGIDGALQAAVRTEAFRSDAAGQPDRAICIANNFVTIKDYIPSDFAALVDIVHAPAARTADIQTEDLVISDINHVCSNDKLGQTTQIPDHRAALPFTAKDFFETFKIAKDRPLVLMLPAATQATRLQATNPTYALCIQTNFTFDKGVTEAPIGFSDLYRKLLANKKAGSSEPIEKTIMDTIVAQCGPESKPQ